MFQEPWKYSKILPNNYNFKDEEKLLYTLA